MEATWNVENSVKLYRLKVGPDINILPNKVGWCQLYLDLDKTGSDRVILCSINWYITKGLYRFLWDIVIEGWLRRNTKALPTTSELNSDPDMASLVSLPCLSAPSSLFCAIKGASTRLGCTVFTLISPSSYSRSQLFRIPPPSPARHHSPPTGHDHNHDSQTSSPPCGETTTISSPRNIGQGSCSTCTVTQDIWHNSLEHPPPTSWPSLRLLPCSRHQLSLQMPWQRISNWQCLGSVSLTTSPSLLPSPARAHALVIISEY